MFDAMNMLGKVREMQAKMKEIQADLGDIIAEGEAAGGMVRAIANGKKQVLKIEMDEDLLKNDNREILQDLIVAAVNKALENAEIKAGEHLKKNTEGLLPNIPGLDLSSFK